MSESEWVQLQLGATQFVLSVLLASHHDKNKLLTTFDRMLSEDQVAALAGGGTGMLDELRAVLEKYRTQIERRS
jgi:hypothetical protein